MLRHAHGAQYLTRSVFFFFIAPATTDISTLSLHDALPISSPGEPALTVEQWARRVRARYQMGLIGWIRGERVERSEEHTSELQSRVDLVCRLLLEKKNDSCRYCFKISVGPTLVAWYQACVW